MISAHLLLGLGNQLSGLTQRGVVRVVVQLVNELTEKLLDVLEVLQDLLGLNPDFRPRFARRFADGAALVRSGAHAFSEAVRSGAFPSDKEGF